jgi:hypothetical protein
MIGNGTGKQPPEEKVEHLESGPEKEHPRIGPERVLSHYSQQDDRPPMKEKMGAIVETTMISTSRYLTAIRK